MTKRITEDVAVTDLDDKTITDVYFSSNESGHNNEKMFIVTKFADYEIGHYDNCCERSRAVITLGDKSNLIGSRILHVITKEAGVPEEYPDEFTVFESMTLFTDAGKNFRVNWEVKSTGCHTEPRLIIYKTYDHCIFTEA